MPKLQINSNFISTKVLVIDTISTKTFHLPAVGEQLPKVSGSYFHTNNLSPSTKSLVLTHFTS